MNQSHFGNQVKPNTLHHCCIFLLFLIALSREIHTSFCHDVFCNLQEIAMLKRWLIFSLLNILNLFWARYDEPVISKSLHVLLS